MFIEGDTVVSVFGMRPNDMVARKIDSKYHNKTCIIGDCDKVGKVGGAVRQGFYAGVSIE